MRLLKKRVSNRGSFTIEAILVIWCIVISLAAVIYSFLIMNQKVLLAAIASQAAQQGAEIWVDDGRSMENGAWESRQNIGLGHLYSQLTDPFLFREKKYAESLNTASVGGNDSYGGKEDKKIVKIRGTVVEKLGKALLKPVSTYMTIEFKNVFIQREIKVTLEQEIKIPLGDLKAILDGKNTLTLAASGTAVVAEPAEYIRNVDLVAEYVSQGAEVSGIAGELEQLKEKFK